MKINESCSILDKIKKYLSLKLNGKLIICIGLDNDFEQNLKIIKCAKQIINEQDVFIITIGYSNIYNNKIMDQFIIKPYDINVCYNFEDYLNKETEYIIKDNNFLTFIGKLQELVKYIDNILKDFSVKNFLEKNKIIITNRLIPVKTNVPELVLIGLIYFKQIFELLKFQYNFEYVDLNLISCIRGSLSSSKFLKCLKYYINLLEKQCGNIEFFSRIALLESIDNYQFLFAPVGIDEANKFIKKKQLIFNAFLLLRELNLNPNIFVMSGGRISDKGRDLLVDKSLEEAEKLVIEFNEYIKQEFRDTNKEFKIINGEILIENAIKYKANFILAPDGISGNLIYRTIVHLGKGKAYGALYSNIFFNHKKVLIDCSRDAEESEILGSFILSIGLLKFLKYK